METDLGPTWDEGRFKELKTALLSQPRGENSLHTMDIDSDMAAYVGNIMMFWALAFRYPERDVYRELEKHLPDMGRVLAHMQLECPPLPAMPDLQAEYVSLFVNNNGYVPAIPYAAPHLDPEGMLMGRSYDLVRECVALAGYELKEPVKELEDHLSLLLELGSVVLRQLPHQKENVTRQADMLQVLFRLIYELLGPMCAPFRTAVLDHAQLAFYPAMVEGLYTLLADADSLLAGLLSWPEETALNKGGTHET